MFKLFKIQLNHVMPDDMPRYAKICQVEYPRYNLPLEAKHVGIL